MKEKFQILKFLFCIALICSSWICAVSQPDSMRVLFVGNSFTYYYNLSQVVSSMAQTQGTVIITRQSTVGGSTLEDHWKSEKGTRTRILLDSCSWDYVVFNNHSLATIDSFGSFLDYSTRFADLVRTKGSSPVFMETWAYKSNPLMQETISNAYQELAKVTRADIVPCGALFAEIRKFRPDLTLFFDDKHPSYIATYMLGLAFYKYFTGKQTTGIPKRITTKDVNGENIYLIFMHQEDADYLQQLVDDYDFRTLQSQ
jgi:hypothetical protein